MSDKCSDSLVTIKGDWSLEEVCRYNLMLDYFEDEAILINPPPPKPKGK